MIIWMCVVSKGKTGLRNLAASVDWTDYGSGPGCEAL